MPSSRKNSSTWQTSAKRSPTTLRIVLQAGKWHQPISHSARRARLQPASEEADGVRLDGNGNIVRRDGDERRRLRLHHRRHKFAAALAGHDRPTEVLHIGDHDPSGVSMFLAFLEDVEA